VPCDPRHTVKLNNRAGTAKFPGMRMDQSVFRNFKVTIDREMVFRLLLMKSNSPSGRLESIISAEMAESEKLLEPGALFRVIKNGRFLLAGKHHVKSAIIGEHLRESAETAVFLATAGHKIDRHISGLQSENPLKALVADAVGSVAAEAAAIYVNERIEETFAREDRATTLRFSPGYCDWPLEYQEVIFQLVDASVLDMSINSSCYMLPHKSISGITGILPKGTYVAGQKRASPCEYCGMQDCAVRR
jgi:hypothetical protein